MGYKYRGLLKNRGEVIDIIDFSGETAKCGDGKDRNIDEFNTIFYPVQSFKAEVLKIVDKEIDEIDLIKEEIQVVNYKKSKS